MAGGDGDRVHQRHVSARGGHVEGAIGWALVAAVVGLLVLTLRAYIGFLRNADELLRKVQLEGLAMAFAAGTVFMVGYRLSERLGARRLDINDPLLVMVVAWGIGQWFGWRRYGAAEVEP